MALPEQASDAKERAPVAGGGDRRAYDELVSRSPQGSVFTTSWWLDAVAPGRWRPHVVEDAGRVVAAWPTVVTRTPWGDVHAGAPLAPFLGPLLEAGEEGQRRRSRESRSLELLLERVQPFAHLEARCHPAFDYWTPLHWHGFEQTTHYTWRLPELGDVERVWAGLRENIRREVRKARKHGVSVDEGSLAELLRLHALSGAEQGRAAETRANAPALRRAAEAASARGAATVLVARDAGGAVHSAGLFVHDDRYTYYLIGASDPGFRTSGAASAVMWEAIERAGARGTAFDFEGSMLRPVERFVRSFGGVPTPYSIVRKTPSLGLRATRTLKRAALLAARRARAAAAR